MPLFGRKPPQEQVTAMRELVTEANLPQALNWECELVFDAIIKQLPRELYDTNEFINWTPPPAAWNDFTCGRFLSYALEKIIARKPEINTLLRAKNPLILRGDFLYETLTKALEMREIAYRGTTGYNVQGNLEKEANLFALRSELYYVLIFHRFCMKHFPRHVMNVNKVVTERVIELVRHVTSLAPPINPNDPNDPNRFG